MAEAKKKTRLSSFSIILLMIIVLGVITHFLPSSSGVQAASLSTVLLAPIQGFGDAIDVCVFVFILGAFLAIVAKTGALETGIKVLVKKLNGKEVILIPILMTIFSIGGTTYGMLEETVGFYALLSFTMVAAGMDTIVASATVLLGAGSGVLGSTVNPFAVGAAVDALKSVGIEINQGTIILLGVLLWLTALGISIAFVMTYAKKVIKDKGSTFLSLQEQKAMEAKYGKTKDKETVKLTGVQKATLWIFAITFLVMIVSFIPWEDFGVTIFLGWTDWFAGVPLGQWYFQESTLWFLVMGIVIGVINRFSEEEVVNEIVKGGSDMMAVVLVIAVSRGVSVLMASTGLDNYIITSIINAIKGMPEAIFTPLNYLLHVLLSILVPSSSGLAGISMPIVGPVAAGLNFNVEVTVMTYVAANGLVNLITPTCGAIMGGLALAGVEYPTWFRWAIKVVACIAVASIFILTVGAIIL